MWFLFSLAYSSEKSQEILKNQNKVAKKHLRKDSLLEKIKVFNQNLWKCRTSGTVLVLKLDIGFIILWDDLMEDGSVPMINIFELLKQRALIDADKNCADSNNCEGWGRLIFCNSTLLGRVLVGTKFCSWSVKAKFHVMWNFLCEWLKNKRQKRQYSWKWTFLPFYVLLKTLLCFHGVWKKDIELK